MNRVYSSGGGFVLVALFATAISGADTWQVKNNLRRDFRLEIRSRGSAEAIPYELKAGKTVSIPLGEDAHTLVTELLQGENKQRLESDEIILKEIADEGPTLLKDIRSPIGITMPNKDDIYQAMPDYPASKKYETLIDRVRQSQWSGTYGSRKGSLKLRGNKGSADDNTRLSNINYVPSDVPSDDPSKPTKQQLVVAGNWEHKGENGEFVLIIDGKNPKQLKGYYRTEGGNWASGTATRTD